MNELDFEVAPRFVFLGESIVSDWRNPLATTARAVMRALGESGFESSFLEPRRNRATVGLLSQRGSSQLRAFNSMWEDLQYRTIDMPARQEVGPWSGQFAATSGVVSVLEGIPELVERGLGEFDGAGVDILFERPELVGDWGRTVLHRFGRPEESIGFRPAVLPMEWNERRSGMVLVAYDDAELAREVAARIPGVRRIVSGSADLPDWEFIPEIELPPLYGAVERVLVVDDGERPVAPARVWLPRANGAAAWGVVRAGAEEASIAVDVSEIGGIWEREVQELPERFDARWVARGLVALYRFRSDGQR